MKKKKKKLWKIYSILIFVNIALFLLLFGVVKNFFIYSDTKESFLEISKRIKKEEYNEFLNKDNAIKNSNKMEVEKYILENMMLKRKGEKVIQLIN